ncbi:MAG TPA: hypothetical protein VN154_02160 [Rhizomicrobium sp.]|nr:hypothetical protein [Rhizomicrobium sp.]
MSSGWYDIAALIVKLVSHEPPFVQILYVLGTAFCVVMFIEGLRVNFLPSRKQYADEPADMLEPELGDSDIPALAAVYANDGRDAIAGGGISLPVRQQVPARKSRFSPGVKTHLVPRPKIRRAQSSSTDWRDHEEL